MFATFYDLYDSINKYYYCSNYYYIVRQMERWGKRVSKPLASGTIMYLEFPAQAPYAYSVSDTGGSEEKKLRSPPRGKICFKNIFTKDNGISSP